MPMPMPITYPPIYATILMRADHANSSHLISFLFSNRIALLFPLISTHAVALISAFFDFDCLLRAPNCTRLFLVRALLDTLPLLCCVASRRIASVFARGRAESSIAEAERMLLIVIVRDSEKMLY